MSEHDKPAVTRTIALNSPAGLAMMVDPRFQLPRHLEFLNDYLADALLAAEAGRLDGVTISCPPQHGKSLLCSRYLPAWYLGTRPERRVILASYETDFAVGWSRQARDVLARHGERLYRLAIDRRSSAAGRWDLVDHGGGMSAAGAGGPITGKGASLLIVDDPVKNDTQARSPTIREQQWEWWQSVASTRLHPGGLFVVIQTRWHRDDLTGRIQEWVRNAGLQSRWRFLRLPALAEGPDPLRREPGAALWPDRYSLEHLERIRSGKSAYYWRALYQQDPQADGGTEWPDAWFRRADLWFDDWPTAWRTKVVALDPSKGTDAKHGDYSAFVMLLVDANGKLWVDADLRRTHATELIETALEIQRQFQPDQFAIESNQFQELLAWGIAKVCQDRRIAFPVVSLPNGPATSKETRIRRLTSYLARGEIRFKANSAGTRLLVDQLRDFPFAEHDDGPDALEMAARVAHALIEGRASEGDFGRVVI